MQVRENKTTPADGSHIETPDGKDIVVDTIDTPFGIADPYGYRREREPYKHEPKESDFSFPKAG